MTTKELMEPMQRNREDFFADFVRTLNSSRLSNTKKLLREIETACGKFIVKFNNRAKILLLLIFYEII